MSTSPHFTASGPALAAASGAVAAPMNPLRSPEGSLLLPEGCIRIYLAAAEKTSDGQDSAPFTVLAIPQSDLTVLDRDHAGISPFPDGLPREVFNTADVVIRTDSGYQAAWLGRRMLQGLLNIWQDPLYAQIAGDIGYWCLRTHNKGNSRPRVALGLTPAGRELAFVMNQAVAAAAGNDLDEHQRAALALAWPDRPWDEIVPVGSVCP